MRPRAVLKSELAFHLGGDGTTFWRTAARTDVGARCMCSESWVLGWCEPDWVPEGVQ